MDTYFLMGYDCFCDPRIKDTVKKCFDMLLEVEIKWGDITTIMIDEKMYSYLGVCSRRGGRFKITINPALLDSSETDLEDTILHEMIHTVDGCWNHGAEWKRKAKMINDRFGYNISRCGNTDAVEKRREEHSPYKYAVECPVCGYRWKYRRWCKTVAHPDHYRCTECDAKLKAVSLVPEIAIAKAK